MCVELTSQSYNITENDKKIGAGNNRISTPPFRVARPAPARSASYEQAKKKKKEHSTLPVTSEKLVRTLISWQVETAFGYGRACRWKWNRSVMT